MSMPLCVFQKLFPSQLDTNGKPTCLYPTVTWLTAYNGSTIPQLGAHDTAIVWRPSSSGPPRHLHSQRYIADTSGPAILSSHHPLSLELCNWTVPYNFHINEKTHLTCQEDQPLSMRKVTGDLSHSQKLAAQHRWSSLPPLNSARTSLPPTWSLWRNWMLPQNVHNPSSWQMQNLSSVQATSVLLLWIHLCMEKLDNSLSRRS